MLIRVYTCQNATLLEISCTGSFVSFTEQDKGKYCLQFFNCYPLCEIKKVFAIIVRR